MIISEKIEEMRTIRISLEWSDSHIFDYIFSCVGGKKNIGVDLDSEKVQVLNQVVPTYLITSFLEYEVKI